MSTPPYNRIAVVGVGLIGGSVALAAKQRGVTESVVGLARSEASAQRLESLSVVDQVTTDWAEGLAKVQLVVVAAPVGATAAVVERVIENTDNDTLITDAASTKADIVSQLQHCPRFVGAHPLAGDHRTGAEHARADLFDGAVTVVTPTQDADDRASTSVAKFWRSLGSRVCELTPEEHDNRLARTSHLPHLVASALAAATPEHDLELAATGWADTTRVAAGSAELWRDILLANAKATRGALSALQEELTAFDAALAAGDDQQIEQLLARGKRRRDALGG